MFRLKLTTLSTQVSPEWGQKLLAEKFRFHNAQVNICHSLLNSHKKITRSHDFAISGWRWWLVSSWRRSAPPTSRAAGRRRTGFSTTPTSSTWTRRSSFSAGTSTSSPAARLKMFQLIVSPPGFQQRKFPHSIFKSSNQVQQTIECLQRGSRKCVLIRIK